MKQISVFLLSGLLALAPGKRSAAQGCTAPSFSAATNFAAGALPYSVVTGDFNGDGRPDVAVANAGSANVSLLLGNGSGGLGAATNFAAGPGPVSVTTGDFNMDGRLDLVVANSGSNNVFFLPGNGSGGLGAATNFAVGNVPRSVTTGDFNGDGRLDLAVANEFSDNVSVLLNNGSGGFGTATNFAAGDGPRSVTTGDFNRDGTLDLAAANFNSGNVSILLNNGSGSFGDPTNFAVGIRPLSIITGDFNGDGWLDMAVANEIGDNVSVLLNNGSGSFGDPTNFAVGIRPFSVTTGDFNGDGKLDLAIANFGSDNVSVLLGNGGGSFGAPTNFAVGDDPFSVTTGDFNGDGTPDLASANFNSGNVSILLNNCTANTPPVITCPKPITVTNDAGQCSASVSFAATATGTPEAAITYAIGGTPITSPYTFPKGQTTVTATATNGTGTDQCTFTVTVTDDEQPVVNCPISGNVNRSAGANCTYAVSGTEFNTTATDNCNLSSLTYILSGATTGSGTSLAGVVLNKGVNTITWSASDGATTPSACSFTVTVEDNTAPVITTRTNPIVLLWSPNHTYQTVTVAQCVTAVADNCSPLALSNVVITRVTSDEQENLPGSSDGNTTRDMRIATNCRSVDLRRERIETGNGRVYTIHLAIRDAAGNTGTATVQAHVQRSQGSNVVVDNGVAYTVTANCLGGTAAASMSRRAANLEAALVEGLQASALPNPSPNYFSLAVQSSSDAPITIRITDMMGRVVETRSGLARGTVQLGHRYTPGMYLAEVVQGSKRVVVQLVKSRD